MKQLSQKPISFKVDIETLNSVDTLVSSLDGRLSDGKPVRINRNKLINIALKFAVDTLYIQLSVLDSRNKFNIMPNFI